jgi:arylsulfatase A-like enzyme
MSSWPIQTQNNWAKQSQGNAEVDHESQDAFTHCFVQNPVCMPSRVSFLTRQYPSTLGITHMGVPVPEETITLPALLGVHGYYSANIGKLHFLPHANRDHRTHHPHADLDIAEETILIFTLTTVSGWVSTCTTAKGIQRTINAAASP